MSSTIKARLLPLLFTVVIGAWAQGARAEVGAGTLSGYVKDAATQKPIPDVTVTVTSPSLQGEEFAVTGKNGDWRISNLPPGEYTVRMDKEAYKPYGRGAVQVRADVTLRIDVLLLPEGLKEDIVVVGKPPTVDIGSAATGSRVSHELVERVPLIRPGGKGSESRSIESAAASAPQAQGDRYGTSINGTTSPENSYILDGLSVGDPGYGTLGTPLTMEFVKELNVITGGYMPEYGKATGGIVSAVTESGGNEFTTSIWGYLSPGALQGSPKRIKREAQTIDTQAQVDDVWDFGLDLGGPIVKDIIWFYVGFDYASISWKLTRSLRRTVFDDSFNPVTNADGSTQTEVIPGTTKDFFAQSRTLQLFGKLTFRLGDSNRLALTLVGVPRWSGGSGKYGIDPKDGTPEVTSLVGTYDRLAHVYDGSAIDVVLKWNSDLVKQKLLLETSLGLHHQVDGTLPTDGSSVGSDSGLAGEPGIIWRRSPAFHDLADFETLSNGSACDAPAGAPEGTQACPVRSYNSGGPGFIEDLNLNRIGFRTVLSWLPSLLGTHVAKAGFELDYMTFHHNRGYSGKTLYRESTGGGSFTDIRQYGFLSGPDQYTILDSLDISTSSTSIGAFLQDSWTITDGFTLNLGLRWDGQVIKGGEGQTALALMDQFSPRIGMIWDPSGKGKAKIFANFALFYEAVPLDIADRAGSGEPQITSVHSKAVCDPSDPEQAKTTCLEDDSRLVIQGPESPDKKWVITGGGLTPVDPTLEAQSSWEFVAGAEYDLGGLADIFEDVRGGVMYTKRWMHNVIEDMSRDEAQTYFIGNPGSGIAKDFPEATRDYDALTVYFMKEWSRCWVAQLSYTLSWLSGNYAGLFRPETLQLDPNINSDFDLKSLTVNRLGDLPGDTRHSIKLFAANDIQLAKGHHLQPGLGVRLSSGGPTNYLGSHPIYSADEVFVLPRGSGERLPWTASIDLHLGYELHVTDTYALTISVDVFNVFNFQTRTAIDETYTSADVNPIIGGKKADLPNLKNADGTDFSSDDINPNFGNTLANQRPRTFRFGIRGAL
ncbi:MAG: TonB-dependent receptor [Myxococcota bacterium]